MTTLQPLRGFVILRPHRGTRARGPIVYPSWERYPQAGECIATSSREIELGDLIAIPVESADVAHSYTKVLAIMLMHEGSILECIAPLDSEPLFRETFDRFLCTGEDRKIILQDLAGEGWSFLCSDVLTHDISETSSPTFSLLYPASVRFIEWEGETLYLIHEKEAICKIRMK